jgi:hypothetical protein
MLAETWKTNSNKYQPSVKPAGSSSKLAQQITTHLWCAWCPCIQTSSNCNKWWVVATTSRQACIPLIQPGETALRKIQLPQVWHWVKLLKRLASALRYEGKRDREPITVVT